MIQTTNLAFNYNAQQVLNDISLTISNSEIVGLIGPSGSGKSTLLKILSGALKGYKGNILINACPLAVYGRKTIQKTVAYYNNAMPANLDERVFDFILLARLPLKRVFQPFSEHDLEITEQRIKHFDLGEYRGMQLSRLPNSILKRTVLAHILNRDTEVLLLDNPDCELDIKSMSLFRKALIRSVMDGDRTILIASNNINFISQTVDRLLVLDQGSLAVDDSVNCITAELLKKYFAVDVIISHNIYNGRPEVHIFPEN